MRTTIMRSRAKDSIVDKECRSHDNKNLFIMSSSVFPSAAMANPTVTVAALALRGAQAIQRPVAPLTGYVVIRAASRRARHIGRPAAVVPTGLAMFVVAGLICETILRIDRCSFPKHWDKTLAVVLLGPGLAFVLVATALDGKLKEGLPD